MKKGFLLGFILAPLLATGQFLSFLVPAKSMEEAGIKSLLEAHYGKLSNELELRLVAENKGVFKQQSFALYRNGFPVQGNMAAAVSYGHRVLISAFLDQRQFEPAGPVSGKGIWRLDSTQDKYFLYSYTDSAGQRTYSPVGSGAALQKEDMRRYSGKDSWTNARVFLPDPLSRNNYLYGGIRQDRGDSTYPELETEQLLRRLDCRFSNDTFFLENRWIQFAEVTPPFQPHAYTTGNFIYTRNDPRFEEVNAFYHICEMSKWWDTLGLSLFRDTVILDAHAYYGADESGFDPTVSPPTIEFGDGGVDDAEDADAPTHEYTHGAFNNVIPNAYFGTQRKAMEEGLCDFMAVAYSNRLTKNQYGWVYNWDGHNEFWIGRDLHNNRVYPGSLTNQEHIDGQIFGGAVFDLAAEIGFDSAVKIVMYTVPLLVPNISMRDGAKLLLQADSLFNNGNTRWPLIKALYPRGLLPDVGSRETNDETLVLKNTYNFAIGAGELYLYPLQTGEIKMFDISGRMVMQRMVEAQQSVGISGNALSPGTYFIQCGGRAYKVIKF